MNHSDSIPLIANPSWGRDLTNYPQSLSWIWPGFLAHGHITLLTSLWKTGKTTLISILLANREKAGRLAGLPLGPGVSAVISEEDKLLWKLRLQRLSFGKHICLFSRPFFGKPTAEQWNALRDRLLSLREEHNLDLVVIDSLAMFLPFRNENHAGHMIEAFENLRDLTAAGIAVLLLHHPRKANSPLGQSARGSAALQNCVDIIIEMHRLTNTPMEDRRRRLVAFSRYPETPSNLLLELNPEGTDYAVLDPATADDDFPVHWSRLRQILSSAPKPYTQREILSHWTFDAPPPKPKTLWRWLTRARRDGLAIRSGKGTKSDPFRYALVEQKGIQNA